MYVQLLSLVLTNLPTIPTKVAPTAIDAAVGFSIIVKTILEINNKTTTPNPNHCPYLVIFISSLNSCLAICCWNS